MLLLVSGGGLVKFLEFALLTFEAAREGAAEMYMLRVSGLRIALTARSGRVRVVLSLSKLRDGSRVSSSGSGLSSYQLSLFHFTGSNANSDLGGEYDGARTIARILRAYCAVCIVGSYNVVLAERVEFALVYSVGALVG